VTYGGGAAGTYQGYDTFGRPIVSYQQTLVQSVMQSYKVSYGYDLSGAMTSETYPSGKIVNTAYDAAGRVTAVSKQGGGSYASGITYAPQGAMGFMTLGNNLVEQTMYNSRLQPTTIELGVSTANPQSVLGLIYTYNTQNLHDNNGNVLTQTINAGSTQIGSQTYTYDAVNRLQMATEGSAWNQRYDYDQFGNRAVRVTSLYIPNPQLTPTSTATGDLSGSISPTNNQIIMQGFGYDLAGNLTADPSPAPMVYDAEDRQTSYTKSGTTGYGYDGDGHRVTKTAGGVTTVFVYNIGGQLIAEYGGPATNGGTSYLTTDSLGSTRVVTDGNKAVIARHDYLPFGEEIPSGIGNRTPGLGYVTTDDTLQRFTSKERDSESAMDYFGARYYSSAAGRFTTPDDIARDSHTRDPRSWNRYAYVRNSPLQYVDPTGTEATVTITTDVEHHTGTIDISASIALYTEISGINESDDARNFVASRLKAGIESTWNGTFEAEGYTWTVNVHVDITFKDSKQDAINSGAGNVVKLVPHGGQPDLSGRDPANTGARHDYGEWKVTTSPESAAHEFGHLLGSNHLKGENLMNTNIPEAFAAHPHPTQADYRKVFGGVIADHLAPSSSLAPAAMGYRTGIRRDPPTSHSSTHETRAARFRWIWE
jgi:RHS repeat-associated protein